VKTRVSVRDPRHHGSHESRQERNMKPVTYAGAGHGFMRAV